MDWSLRRAAGDSVNVGVVTMSVHTGTHVDGGHHYADAGRRAAELHLDAFIGPALVVHASPAGDLGLDDVRGIDLAAAQRILFRTRAHVDATVFPDAFAAISPPLARALAEAGVRLVGTDAPSVDPRDSKTLEAHHILNDGGVAILENLVLGDVPAGRYTLVALPLKLVEADSSPVRAVLLEENGSSTAEDAEDAE
jgi:arylformamidase